MLSNQQIFGCPLILEVKFTIHRYNHAPLAFVSGDRVVYWVRWRDQCIRLLDVVPDAHPSWSCVLKFK